MKYALQLGFLAIVLFSVSAGLSVWLYQNRQTTESNASGEKTNKKSGADPERPESKENKSDGHAEPKTHKKDPSLGPSADAAAMDALRERLARRSEQYELILRDLQSQREAQDALIKQIIAELKLSTGKVAELESKTAELDKKKVDLDAAEKKNIERMAALYDSMSPETAAPILKQMADTGRLDTAVKILALMKERQAARVLESLGDPMFAAQLLERMRGLKTTPGVSQAGATQTSSGAPSPIGPNRPGP